MNRLPFFKRVIVGMWSRNYDFVSVYSEGSKGLGGQTKMHWDDRIQIMHQNALDLSTF